MYTDDKLYFDGPTASTTIAGNNYSQNWIDLGTLAAYGGGIDLPRGRSLRTLFTVKTAPTTSTGWVQIQLVLNSNIVPLSKTYTGITSNTGAGAVFTFTGHALYNGMPIRFTSFSGGTGVTAERIYYARYTTDNTFTIHTTYAGATAANATTNVVEPSVAMSAGAMRIEPPCVASSGILDAAALTVGTTIELKFNPPPKYHVDFDATAGAVADKKIVQYEGTAFNARYISARYVVGGTIAGLEFNAPIILDAQEGHKHHASGFTV